MTCWCVSLAPGIVGCFVSGESLSVWAAKYYDGLYDQYNV
jgi:hypothetical protein